MRKLQQKGQNLKQVTDYKELKENMDIIVCYIPGREKRIRLIKKPTAKEQSEFRSFLKKSIELGVIYKEI